MTAACLCPCAVLLTSLGVVCEVMMLLVGLYPLLASLSFPKCQHLVARFNTSEDKKVAIYSGVASGLFQFVIREVFKEELMIILISPGLYFVLWLCGCPDFSSRVVIIRLQSEMLGAAL